MSIPVTWRKRRGVVEEQAVSPAVLRPDRDTGENPSLQSLIFEPFCIKKDRLWIMAKYWLQSGAPVPERCGGARKSEERAAKMEAVKDHIRTFTCRFTITLAGVHLVGGAKGPTNMKLRDFNVQKNRRKLVFFALLLSTAFVFLLYNRKAYLFILDLWQQWHNTPTVCLTKPALKIETSSPTPETTESTTTLTEPEPEVQRCSYKHLSPENTVEGRRLLDSITWPETLPVPKPFSLNLTTNAAKSTFSIVPRSGGWRVGDELTVRIQVNDYNGNPKKGGGDFIISRLYDQKLGAGVVGQVQDHLNGTFTAVFPLLWNGTAQVKVVLIQTSEAITVLKRLTEEQPGRVLFSSEFRSGSVKESSTCDVCLDPAKAPVCNLTDLNTGEQWFCYKPKTLSCDTRASHVIGGYSNRISKDEETLFTGDVSMKAPIKASGTASVTILPKAGESKQVRPGPSGYYYKNQWRPLGGTTVRQFNNASVVTACLKGKQLHLFGDSTVRQYYEHITKTLPKLQRFDHHSSAQGGPFLAMDNADDILLTFRCHGPPLRITNIPVSQLQYVANELNRLPGGPNTVVLIGVWAHFGNYPMEVYYQRLVTIRKAIQRLKNRAPDTKVIVRTANLKHLTLHESLTNSDWYTLQRDRLLRAVFKDMDVLLLEAWEMVQASDLEHNLHPPPQIIRLMIDGILSYTCPIKEG